MDNSQRELTVGSLTSRRMSIRKHGIVDPVVIALIAQDPKQV